MEETPTRQELIDCILNLIGCFDTPVSRMKISGEIPDEARKIGRDIIEKLRENGEIDPIN